MSIKHIPSAIKTTIALAFFSIISCMCASTASATNIGGHALDRAYAYQGASYAEGAKGTNPHVFDCSGLIQRSAHDAGLELGNSGTYVQAYQERDHLSPVSTRESLNRIQYDAQRGDVVFFFDNHNYPQHVGFYDGNNTIYDSYNYCYQVGDRPISKYHFPSAQVYRLHR